MSIMLTQEARDEARALLCGTIETVTVNPASGEQPLAERLRDYARAAGLLAEIQAFAPERANVVVRLKGRRAGPALLLNGHLDTVPFGAADSWDTPPDRATIRDGMLYGRGASDMKSGLCAALYALCFLARRGFTPEHDILFIGTGDEETHGLGAQAVVDSGLLSDVGGIVIGEPTGNRIALASKGTLWLEGTVRGKTCHGAYPWQGVNAVETAIKLIELVRVLIGEAAHPYLTPPTCTLTQISGGVKANMVPDCCTFTLDIRTIPGICHEAILRGAEEAAKQLCGEGAQISFRALTNRMAVETVPEATLVRILSAAVEAVTGEKPALTGTGFFSDASIFLREAAIPTVLFGPGESDEAHKPNESLSLARYEECIACYMQLLEVGFGAR